MRLRTHRRVLKVKRSLRWWTPWDHRGTVHISDLPELHELTPRIARHLSDMDLHLFPQVRFNDAVAQSVIAAEIRRREGKTARLALLVSVVAVAISFAALILSKK